MRKRQASDDLRSSARRLTGRVPADSSLSLLMT
jgi:hypothetical protein